MKAARLYPALGASLLTAVVVVACGNVYADPVEAPYSFGSGFGVDAAPITLPKDPPVPCPNVVRENAPCSVVGLACEFGTSSDPACNSLFTCARDPSAGAYWTETRPAHCDGTCPAPEQIVDGAPCTLASRPDSGISDDALELQCSTATRLCACTTGPDGAHAHERRWVCIDTGDGCPTSRPNIGHACLGDRSCNYGGCDFKRGQAMKCEEDVWQVETKSCP